MTIEAKTTELPWNCSGRFPSPKPSPAHFTQRLIIEPVDLVSVFDLVLIGAVVTARIKKMCRLS